MQQELDRFLTAGRPNRLMLMTLARRVNVGTFTLSHCKDALLDKAHAHGQQVACLVISGDSVKIFTPGDSQAAGQSGRERLAHEALEYIDQVGCCATHAAIRLLWTVRVIWSRVQIGYDPAGWQLLLSWLHGPAAHCQVRAAQCQHSDNIAPGLTYFFLFLAK